MGSSTSSSSSGTPWSPNPTTLMASAYERILPIFGCYLNRFDVEQQKV